jgi:hypothetical protein
MRFSYTISPNQGALLKGPSQYVAVTCGGWDGKFSISYPDVEGLDGEMVYQISAFATETIVPKAWPVEVVNISATPTLQMTVGQG